MNNTDDNILAGLFRSIAFDLARHSSNIADQCSRALLSSTNSTVEKPPATLAQCKELPRGPAAHDAPLLQTVLASLEHLHWAENADNNGPDVFKAQLAFVELLGPTGMVLSSDCRVGLLLICRDNYYPAHRHAAEELYFVVDGTAQWSSERSEPTYRPPGSFIHHQSWETHTMVTHDEPLLAVWCWTGDVSFSSYEMVSDEVADEVADEADNDAGLN